MAYKAKKFTMTNANKALGDYIKKLEEEMKDVGYVTSKFNGPISCPVKE